MVAAIAPAEAVRNDTAKAARAPPKASRGMLYILTLNAATAAKLSEIPAHVQAGWGAKGNKAVTSEITAASRHTRNRAGSGGTPRSTNRRESQPPAIPPSSAHRGGIQVYQAACPRVR